MRPKTVKRCQKLHVRYLVTAALNQTDRSPSNLAVHDFAPNVCFGAMTKIGRTTRVGAKQTFFQYALHFGSPFNPALPLCRSPLMARRQPKSS